MSDKMMRVSYGEALVELGKVNEKVVVLDADLAHATFTGTFQNAFPDRFFNVGIAESNLVGLQWVIFLSVLLLLYLEQEELMNRLEIVSPTQK